MDINEFVIKIHDLITKERITIYKDMFNNTNIEKVKNNYWKEALEFYHSIDQKQKEMLFKIIRQISVDTVSTIFALLDGVSIVEGQDDRFILSFKKNPTVKINGDLQDIFLEHEEISNE